MQQIAASISPHHAQRTVHPSDKRAQFVGLAEYEAAGGVILRDLFESDDGGWLQDPALLDKLVAEKLERERVRSESDARHYMSGARTRVDQAEEFLKRYRGSTGR